MNDFIYLPPYEEYQAYWINLNHVQSIRKLEENKVMILYSNNTKEVLSGLWARVILEYLNQPEYKEMMASTKYFDEV